MWKDFVAEKRSLDDGTWVLTVSDKTFNIIISLLEDRRKKMESAQKLPSEVVPKVKAKKGKDYYRERPKMTPVLDEDVLQDDSGVKTRNYGVDL